MIRKVVINNFKKFEYLEFDLSSHLVIAGPNNSGKTTLLQAIAAWSEIASQWSENNPDLARDEEGNYPSIDLNSELFYSVPLVDFEHLWKDKNVQESAFVWLHTDQWKIGFEILYTGREFATARPAIDVKEDDLEQYINDQLFPIYISPLSGVEIKESPFDPVVIPARLARAQAGSVLRNLLLIVSQDAQKWQKLQEVVKSFFGYELLLPSAGAEIYARYRHSEQGQTFDLSSAASGFLQVLLVYSALLAKEASVLLIDEPDAHLHILLQDKMYRDLRDYAHQNGTQLIIATHSERLINATANTDINNLRLLAGNLRKIPDKRRLVDTLFLENVEILLANTEPRILYIEGHTDIDILTEWVRVLEHSLLSFLEKQYCWETAQHEWPAVKHFSAMRLIVPHFRAVELRDGDDKDHSSPPRTPEGMKRLYWERYEIESYLIHPQSIVRFVKSVSGQEAADRADNYMKQQFPPALYEDPFSPSDHLAIKGKNTLSEIMRESGINVQESEYYRIAAQMTQEEIHPEVVEKLDAIADHFNL